VTIRSSIVIPVHNHAGLTQRCLQTLLAQPPEPGFEVIVVDDASTDSTAKLLAGYEEPVRSVTLDSNSGFAAACNLGAAAARGEYLVFLNNDTLPSAGWLDALVRYADAHPAAAVVGSKLLFLNGTIQHAGVVICQDGYPRHIYAGLPAHHPAVCESRRFQAVTAGCALVRHNAFDEVGGFDESFQNSFEDADLCLRLGERGYEVHYCHESVLHHLESASRSRRSKETERSANLFRERWRGRARADDLDYYVADGLLELRYRDLYPIGLEVSPELASVTEDRRRSEADRLIERQAQQVADLLRETVRLTAHIAELELGKSLPEERRSIPTTRNKGEVTEPLRAEKLLERVEEIAGEIYDLQQGIAEAAASPNAGANGAPAFEAGKGLGYRKLVKEIRDAVEASVPADSTVLVISRGDDHLLELGRRAAWHFPQDERGTYSGHHPPDSSAAIEQLEALRGRGADYLLVPATAGWWLEHYTEFATHLGDHYAELTGSHESCRLFSLHALEGREKLG
jgi:GT2 family glycosyltransferase